MYSQSNRHPSILTNFCRLNIVKYIHKSRLFPMGVCRNYRKPPVTILTYSSRLIHIRTSDRTRTPVASTTNLTFLKNLRFPKIYKVYLQNIPTSLRIKEKDVHMYSEVITTWHENVWEFVAKGVNECPTGTLISNALKAKTCELYWK